jgi:VRR-NUC domain
VSQKPEESFQSAVVDMAHLYGWIVAHFRRARTARGWTTAVGADGKGWPDLFLCHERSGRVLARELKVPPNRVTPEQVVWLRVLNMVGVDAKVWTTADWTEIEATLSG